MWDVLEVTHGGMNEVKRARKHDFIQEFELFKMQKGEYIAEVQKSFTHIVNHLMGLGKEFNKDELNIKVLKCLDRNWQPKVTTISESKNLTIITTAALFGKLYEIEMQRLSELESNEKKVKTIALKVSSKKSDETGEEATESSDNKNLNLLVKRFGKYLKRKGNKGNQRRYISKQNDSSNSFKFSCYNCGKQGHIKIECPNVNKENEKIGDGKKEKKAKERCAYTAWEDNDDSTSTLSQEESEEAKLCLMAGYGSSSSSQVSSLSSKYKNDYYQLLHDFEEFHSEANKIAVMNKGLKGLNSWLENRVSQLELGTVNLKIDFEHWKMIYSNSSDCFEKHLAIKHCENLTTLKNKVKYLLKTCEKFTRGKTNLEVVLGSQNFVFGKAGLSYTPIHEKKVKKF